MRQLGRTHPRQVVVGLVIGLFMVGAILQPQVEKIENKATRLSLVEDAMGHGMTEAMATCVADRLEERVGPDLAVQTADDAQAVQQVVVACLGLDPNLGDCVFDAMFETAGYDHPDPLDLVAAEASLDAEDRESIAQASLRCQGASEEVAACVTDAMRRAFGKDVFEAKRLELSPEDQQRQAALTTACDERDGGALTQGVLTEDCAVWSERLEEVQGDLGGSNDDVLRGLGDRAEEALLVADDAPEGIREAVRTIAEKLAGIDSALDEIDVSEVEDDDVAGTDDLTDQVAASMNAWGQEGNDAVYTIGEHCNLLDVAETLDGPSYAALFEPGGELDAFVRHGLVGLICIYGHCGSQTGGFGGLLGEEAQSGMNEQAQDCWEAYEALGPGDNGGCDDLYEGCAAGNMLACNDLSENASDGGEYARFGNTCGDRADTPDLEHEGRCELLE